MIDLISGHLQIPEKKLTLVNIKYVKSLCRTIYHQFVVNKDHRHYDGILVLINNAYDEVRYRVAGQAEVLAPVKQALEKALKLM